MTLFPNFYLFFCTVVQLHRCFELPYRYWGFWSGKYDQIVSATKNFGNFLDSISLKSRGLIQHKPALSPAYLLFLVSSLHKYDLYPSSERGVPITRNITQSIFSTSETRPQCGIYWKAQNCWAWKSSFVKCLKTHGKKKYFYTMYNMNSSDEQIVWSSYFRKS